MRLGDLVRDELVAVDLAAGGPDEAIASLVDLLVREGDLPADRRDDALAAVLDRESTRSTGMGHGVAIPHAPVEGLDEMVCAVGLAPDGIEFDALDGRPVQLVILLLVPPNRIQTHVRTLAGIARVLNDARLREDLKDAGTADEVVRRIRTSEADAPT